MSLKDMLIAIFEDISISKETPEEWELPFYGFEKSRNGLQRVKSLSFAQKKAFDEYRNFMNSLIIKYGGLAKTASASLSEKLELEKFRKAWEKVFPEARLVPRHRPSSVLVRQEANQMNESENDVIKNKIIANAIEMVGTIPERDEKDAEKIINKYNGDHDLAMDMLAGKISKTQNKAISERFVNCIRVIHALKVEKGDSGETLP